LYAILIHSGSINSGHYYCFLKLENQWYKFNDKVVSEIDAQQAFNIAMGGYTSNFQLGCNE
jgi:ubiquitin C-terminal hydrolase